MSVESEKSGHNGVLCRRTFAGAAAAALTLTALRVANAQKTEPAGLVEDIKGEGFAEAAIARRVLERNSPVFIADLIGTGAVSRKHRLGHLGHVVGIHHNHAVAAFAGYK